MFMNDTGISNNEWVKPTYVNPFCDRTFTLQQLTKIMLDNPNKSTITFTQKKFPAVVDVKIGKKRLSKEDKKNGKEENAENVYTVVMFDDGTVEKAAVSDGDEYNLEQGIQICLAKKAFSLLKGNGSGAFNDLVNSTIKLYNSKEAEKEKAKKAEEQAKADLKAKADKIKRKNEKKREKRINEMAEAYARAMKMASEGNNNV